MRRQEDYSDFFSLYRTATLTTCTNNVCYIKVKLMKKSFLIRKIIHEREMLLISYSVSHNEYLYYISVCIIQEYVHPVLILVFL